MTAANAFVQERAAYLLTDMALTDHVSGQLLAVDSKFIRGLAPYPWGLAVTGNVGPHSVLQAIDALNPVTPEQMFERLPEIVQMAADIAEREFALIDSSIRPKLAVTVAMWSFRQKGPIVAACDLDGSTYPFFEPLTPFSARGIISGGADMMSLLGREQREICDHRRFDPRVDGVALIAAQRAALKWSYAPGAAEAYRVGGGVQLMRVGKRGVTIETLHTWAEDRVGELILPDGATLQ